MKYNVESNFGTTFVVSKIEQFGGSTPFPPLLYQDILTIYTSTLQETKDRN